MSASNWVHLDVAEIKAETEKAFLLLLDDGEEVWIPFGQIDEAEKYSKGDTDCVISVTEWIANQKGLS